MIEGSCHCGRIKLTLEGEPTEAFECNCSHCSRKGYLLSFVPRDRLKVEGSEGDIGTYTFRNHLIQHHFCRTCGCAPYAESETEEGARAAVNLRCFDVELGGVSIQQIDGRSF